MHYFVYLDEFGHIGPFVSRDDLKHKTSPIFGLGGLGIPVGNVRELGMWFFKLKQTLLAYDLRKSGIHPAQWEKKGSALYTVKNIEKYRELRLSTNRLINHVKAVGGFAFYTGIEKEPPCAAHRPEGLYIGVFKDALRKIDKFCARNDATFSVFLDAIDSNDPGSKRKFRLNSIDAAGKSMFGQQSCFRLLEPPYQLESHLYQNMQTADWFCALFGRILTYEVAPYEYPEYKPFREYFGTRLDSILKANTLLRRNHARIISLPCQEAGGEAKG